MSVARRSLIAGNWKMNGLRGSALACVRDLAVRAKSASALKCDVVLCPPAILLWPLGEALKGSAIALGAQDCHARDSGAHTGDLSAQMIAEAGCRYAIVGHSERRAAHGETDSAVAAKAKAAHGAGLAAIVCVGESQAERDGGRALAVVARQLMDSVPEGADTSNTIIAYEPIWAIGTGRTPSVAEIVEVHAVLRSAWERGGAASLRVLYGGSVKASNAAGILALDGVDGALVGGASLDAGEFWRIIESCP
ncbi:MAG: triose-phosphate isomerase [Alphaproteobacteria bacterium]